MLIVDKASKIVEEEKVKLIVVDSLISHFRGEYVGREMLSERQQKLNQHIHKLLRLAEFYNCAVVITNQDTVESHGVSLVNPNNLLEATLWLMPRRIAFTSERER